MAKIKIKAKEFVADVRAGWQDSDLREKYDLSDRQLGKLFEKLLDQGKLKTSDLDDKSHVFEATLELASTCPHCGSLLLVETDRCPSCERPIDLQKAEDEEADVASESKVRQESSEDTAREDHTVRLDGLEFDLFQAENALEADPPDLESGPPEPRARPEPVLEELLDNLPDGEEPLALDDLDFDLSQAAVEQYEDVEGLNQPAAPELKEDSLVLDDLAFDLTTHDGEDYELAQDADSDIFPEVEFGKEPSGGGTGVSEATAKTVRMDDPEFELVLPFAKKKSSADAAIGEGAVKAPPKSERAPSPVPEKGLLDSDSLAIEPLDDVADDDVLPDDDRIDFTLQTPPPVQHEPHKAGLSAKRLLGFATGSIAAAAVILVVAGLLTGMISLPTDIVPSPAWLLSTFFQRNDAPDVGKAGAELRKKTPKPKAAVSRRIRRAKDTSVTARPVKKIVSPEPEKKQVAVIDGASGELSMGRTGMDAAGDLRVVVKPKPTASLPKPRAPEPVVPPPLPVSRRKPPEKKVEREHGGMLLAAVKAGDLEHVEKLLDEGADVDALNPQGVTAIMAAIESLSEPMTRLLLNSGADTGLRDRNGATALRLACQSGRTELVRLLVEGDKSRGADLLLEVCRKGRTDWVRLLLEGGAPVDAKDAEGNTGLMLASGNGRLEVVRLLLEKGADVRLRNHKGVNALGWARAPSGENYVSLPIRREMVRLLKDHARGRGSISQRP